MMTAARAANTPRHIPTTVPMDGWELDDTTALELADGIGVDEVADTVEDDGCEDVKVTTPPAKE